MNDGGGATEMDFTFLKIKLQTKIKTEDAMREKEQIASTATTITKVTTNQWKSCDTQ